MRRKPEKEFDAVRLMREVREQITRDIEGMTFDEEKAYIRERLTPAHENTDRPPQEHAA